MPQPPAAAGAYLVEPSSYGVAQYLANLQREDVPTVRAAGSFSAGGREFAPGTLVVPPSARARLVLQSTSRATGLPVYATDASPKVAGFQLKPGTRVGLIRGINNQAGGRLMWQLDQHRVDYRVVRVRRLGAAGGGPARLRRGVRGQGARGLRAERDHWHGVVRHPDRERRPGTIGLPVGGTEMKVVGDRGEALGPGEPGEIVMRGPFVMRGYWIRLPQPVSEPVRWIGYSVAVSPPRPVTRRPRAR
jgi:hypothetical protein